MTNFTELRDADLARREAKRHTRTTNSTRFTTVNGIHVTRRSAPTVYRVIAPSGHPMAGQCVVETTSARDASQKRREIKGYVTDGLGVRVMVR